MPSKKTKASDEYVFLTTQDRGAILREHLWRGERAVFEAELNLAEEAATGDEERVAAAEARVETVRARLEVLRGRPESLEASPEPGPATSESPPPTPSFPAEDAGT